MAMYENTYIIDSEGNKQAVVIGIDEYNELMEEIEDLKAIVARQNDELINHDEVVKIVNG
jgi:PHD/YefM family antitoxin component YafN of YafNO toxin-antitoxin module